MSSNEEKACERALYTKEQLHRQNIDVEYRAESWEKVG
jgi:hypothetical protein